MSAAAVTAAQELRGTASGMPRSRAVASNRTPAPTRLMDRKVQTETSLTASGNNAQLVPHTKVRRITRGRALAEAERGIGAHHAVFLPMPGVEGFQESAAAGYINSETSATRKTPTTSAKTTALAM